MSVELTGKEDTIPAEEPNEKQQQQSSNHYFPAKQWVALQDCRISLENNPVEPEKRQFWQSRPLFSVRKPFYRLRGLSVRGPSWERASVDSLQ